MPLNLPNFLTLARIALVPVLVVFFYLPFHWANVACVSVYILAAVTDWLDGAIARGTGQMSQFGAFLDPVADKIMVATALILLVQQHPNILFALASAVIVGREITISALREWMSVLGARGIVQVSIFGKMKTIFQMTAIGFLLYRDNIGWVPVQLIGEILLYLAAALTLWSMFNYVRAAWPTLIRTGGDEPEPTEPAKPIDTSDFE